MRYYLLIIALSAVFSAVATWLILQLSKRYKLAPKVRERDMHKTPTPRLGGVAMFVAGIAAFFVAAPIGYFAPLFENREEITGIFLGALVTVVIGALDDLFDLHWTIKLLAQFGVGGILVAHGVMVTNLPIPDFGLSPEVVGGALTILAVALTMNAVNFIDGLDGLVAGVAIIANGVFFVYSYILLSSGPDTSVFNLASLLSAILIGCALGFLVFNWHPAKIFMGDSGALLVGFLMATTAIIVTAQYNFTGLGQSQVMPAFIPILIPFAILLLPFVDFALAVVRRLSAGRTPFSPDRQHLHHRLVDLGHGHLRVVLIFYAWTAVFAVGALLLYIFQSAYRSYYLAIPVVLLFILVCAWVTFAPVLKRSDGKPLLPSSTGGKTVVTAKQVFLKALIWASVVLMVAAVLGSILGYLAGGRNGLTSTLIAGGVVLAFHVFTILSIVVVLRFDPVYLFGAVLGSWLLKLVLFIVVLVGVRDQSFIDPVIFFLALVVGLVLNLLVDAIIMMKSKLPYVSDLDQNAKQ